MRKVTLIMGLSVLLALVSCGKGNKTANKGKTDTTKAVATEVKKMTVENAAQLDYEQAKLLMEKYWSEFKGKDYSAVKDIYAQYQKEIDEIYQKHGVSTNRSGFNKQSYTYWHRDHRQEMKEYRKNHPDLDFYEKYPEYIDALTQVSKYIMAEFKEKLSSGK